MSKGKNIAYVRVSTVEQNEARQREALGKYNIDKWFIEKASGKTMKRPKLQEMLGFIREDDVVYVEEFSRLGRTAYDLLSIVKRIENTGAKFVSLKENFDTSTPTGRLQLTMMAAIAEFEREMILERQREGIAIAKKEGRYKGRNKIVVPGIEEYYNRYMTRQATKTQIAKELKIIKTLRNSTIFITGATGLVGLSLVRALLNYNDLDGASNKIIGMARNRQKTKDLYKELCNRKDLKIVYGDILDEICITEDVDYIIHCASVTASKMMVEEPVETIMTALQGTKNILDFSVKKKCKSFVYVSSMEVYGSFFSENNNVEEENIGYLDPLKIRSNYPESKRMCENMCIAYMAEYGVPVRIARLAQTFGAGILPGENRVFAQFARSVIRNENIVLHTKGLSEGNYCYTSDTCLALLLLLEKGTNGEAYNISNPTTHTTIANMASMVCDKIAENKIKVVFDVPESNTYGYAADTKMRLNIDKMRKLGWTPRVGLEEAYRRLIGSMVQTNE